MEEFFNGHVSSKARATATASPRVARHTPPSLPWRASLRRGRDRAPRAANVAKRKSPHATESTIPNGKSRPRERDGLPTRGEARTVEFGVRTLVRPGRLKSGFGRPEGRTPNVFAERRGGSIRVQVMAVPRCRCEGWTSSGCKTLSRAWLAIGNSPRFTHPRNDKLTFRAGSVNYRWGLTARASLFPSALPSASPSTVRTFRRCVSSGRSGYPAGPWASLRGRRRGRH